jgi:hypothetical protein
MVKDVEVSRLDPGRFEGVLDADRCRRFVDRLAQAADRLAGRRLWQVNSTEQGGGVAEMLHFSLGYLVGAGIDTYWTVIEGNEEFFEVTKTDLYDLVSRSTSDPTAGAARIRKARASPAEPVPVIDRISERSAGPTRRRGG